jgi:hypothetical protein
VYKVQIYDLGPKMINIFSRLYKLKKNSDKTPEEDFLTEVFAYLIDSNHELLISFLTHFNILTLNENIFVDSVEPQKHFNKLEGHDQSSRVDLVIHLRTHIIFIENKVNSKQGDNQLKRYAEILDVKFDVKKTLVFLTKDFEKISHDQIKSECNKRELIEIKEIRWYEIHDFLLKKAHNIDLAVQLLQFLENDMNINSELQFNLSDLIAMKNVSRILKMMEKSIYGKVKTVFLEKLELKSQGSLPEIQVRRENRYVYFHSGKGFHIVFGFFFDSISQYDYPRVGIHLWREPNTEKTQNISSVLNEIVANSSSWKSFDNLNNSTIWANIFIEKSIVEFLNTENNIESIENYLIECIEELSKVKNKFEKYL